MFVILWSVDVTAGGEEVAAATDEETAGWFGRAAARKRWTKVWLWQDHQRGAL